MSTVISDYMDCSKYNQTLNTSLASFERDYVNNLKGISSNTENSNKNTFSFDDVFKYELHEFKDMINNQAIEFYNEKKDFFHKIAKNDNTLNVISSNISKSINNYENVVQFCSNLNFIIKFKPEIEFDDDGELSFEWYGRKGARANLTFGKNGEMYFVSLFHGESQKDKLFLNENSIKNINDKLLRIYEDKVA
jgi:hypothetical protein